MRIACVTSVGGTAHAALTRSRGHARVFAPMSAAIYVVAGHEIIWLCADDVAHARAVLCTAMPGARPVNGATVVLDVEHVAPWRSAPGPRTRMEAAAMVAGARRLRGRFDSFGAPQGFGCLSANAQASFPVGGGAARARALARACSAGDAEASAAAALLLVGLGPGLTPSGDDFTGAAFFARTLLARAAYGDAGEWRAAAAVVMRAAPSLTHPISVALLGDLLDGSAPAPLHDLAYALANEAPASVADDAARRLARIGHTSGWDMLAGFVAGCGGVLG
jgi:hypothetical protein